MGKPIVITMFAGLIGCGGPDDLGCEVDAQIELWVDADGDGFGLAGTPTLGCEVSTGFADNPMDCDDASAEIAPGAEEACNNQDDDCDGQVDEGHDRVLYFTDADGDSFGYRFPAAYFCVDPGPGWSLDDLDCDDSDPSVHPMSIEVCNGGIDDDCDGLADDADTSVDPETYASFYRDADGDGQGDPDLLLEQCVGQIGFVDNDDDCDDSDAAITQFDVPEDADLDGYGSPTETILGCIGDVGVSENTDDCDDSDPWVNIPKDWYLDLDGDGWGNGVAQGFGCFPPANNLGPFLGDCDDSDPLSYPGAEDVCEDGIDQDCDGNDSCIFTFSGIMNNVEEVDLIGWDLCWTGNYATNESLNTITGQCNRQNLMLVCRPNGASAYSVLAHAPRQDVLFDTGTGVNSTHNANGVSWYYNNSYSWGFAAQGDGGVSRNSCDTQTGALPEHRLCWHTGGNSINSGWRCGTNTSLNGSTTWTRSIYHADF